MTRIETLAAENKQSPDQLADDIRNMLASDWDSLSVPTRQMLGHWLLDYTRHKITITKTHIKEIQKRLG